MPVRAESGCLKRLLPGMVVWVSCILQYMDYTIKQAGLAKLNFRSAIWMGIDYGVGLGYNHFENIML